MQSGWIGFWVVPHEISERVLLVIIHHSVVWNTVYGSNSTWAQTHSRCDIAHRLALASQISDLLFELFLSQDHSGHHLLILFFRFETHLLFLFEFAQHLLHKFLLMIVHFFHDCFCFQHIYGDTLLITSKRLSLLGSDFLQKFAELLWCLITTNSPDRRSHSIPIWRLIIPLLLFFELLQLRF